MTGVTLCLACRNGSLALVKKYVEGGADVNAASDEANGTPLRSAAFYGHAQVIAYLVEQGADLKKAEVFHTAAQRGHYKMVEKLLDSKIDIELKDKDGSTALHMAAYGGEIYVFKLLVKKGANVKTSNMSGRTALHEAAQRGYREIVEQLLKSGTDLNAQDFPKRRTPLYYACKDGQAAMAELLIAGKADTRGGLLSTYCPLRLASAGEELAGDRF